MQPIVCRYDFKAWLAVVSCMTLPILLMAGSLLDPQMIRDPTPRYFIWPLCAVFLWAAAYLASDISRGEVRADDDGLRWRAGFGGWKGARWDEISDFYLNQIGGHTIESPAGKCEFGSSRTRIDEIIALVPQRAVNAGARAWGVRGYRPHEAWQQTAVLWPGNQKWKAPLLTALMAPPAICAVGSVFVAGMSMLARPFSWWLLGSALVPLSLLGCVALAFVWVVRDGWRERQVAWENREQKLHLDANGVQFESDAGAIEARWSEIERVERLPNERGVRRYRVRTARGNFVLWKLSDAHGMWEPFRARCRDYAPAALEGVPDNESHAALDAEIRPAPAGDNELSRVFSFGTRANRLITWAVSATVFAVPIVSLSLQFNGPLDQPFAPAWLLFGAGCVLAATISLLLYLWFARAFIVAAEDLQLHSPFRRTRHIVWDEIETVDEDIWGRYVRVGGRKIYWMRWLCPARAGELEKLIYIHWLLQT